MGQRAWQTPHQRRWQISIWKHHPHHLSSGKCKSKQQTTNTSVKTPPKQTTPNADKNVERKQLSFVADRNATPCCHFRRHFGNFLTKLNLPFPLSVSRVLAIYPKELKTYVHTKTCMRVFTATLSTTAKTWTQPRCPSVGEWINCGTSRQWNIIILSF